MRKVTMWVFLATFIALCVYDAYCYFEYGNSSTISSIFANNGSAHPILSFSFGVLIGHFFWTAKAGSTSDKIYGFVCSWPLIAMYVGFAASYLTGAHALVIFLAGIPAGHIIFQQKQVEQESATHG